MKISNSIIPLLLAALLSGSVIDAKEIFPEKSMVIGIPSYNNKDWCIRNIESACSQKYQNYKVIFVDDASTDGTSELVQEYIAKHGLQDRVTYIRNQKRMYAMHNWYMIVHLCDDDDIVINLDGDDELAHANVLSRVNEEYSKAEVWLTYGQFKNVQTGRRGYCCAVPDHIVKANGFRKFGWHYAALRTYYAWLFKLIKKEDLCYNGEFVSVCCDTAMMPPMLEMAGERHKFISEILYLRNITGQNDFAVHLKEQKFLGPLIGNGPSYQRLESRPTK